MMNKESALVENHDKVDDQSAFGVVVNDPAIKGICLC
jgi:hypothetical protein